VDDPRPIPQEETDIQVARQVDAICRRFEADWRAGQRQLIGDYVGDVAEAGRLTLHAELEALERELRQGDETAGGREPGSVAEAATIAPVSPPTSPIPGMARTLVHEEATVPPRDPATVDLGSAEAIEPSASELTRVRYFGDYELLREIARGGMGVVYRARQISLNRPVALKMILAGQLAGDDEVKRFYLEAEAAANLDHPGIVPIYEIGEHDGQHFFSMGFVEGTSLAAKVADGPLPPHEAAELVRQVADAVEYAHAKGVIHRDLKPANVLIDAQGRPKVTDFGLAKKLQADSGLTHTGQVMGTPSYMPPEQAEGKNVGPSADVYALGAILYCLLTGRPPFQAATPMDTLLQVVGQDPVPVRQLNATVARDLETICLKCLEKEPGKRYGSARELAEDMDRFLTGRPILARPVGMAERLVRWCRRNPALAAMTGAVALSLLVGTVASTVSALRTSAALADAQRERAAARERLWESLTAQGRAERLAGSRWAAIQALGDAARMKPAENLRQEAVQAIAAPGVRLEREIPFGQTSIFRFSSDGALLAVRGTQFGDPGDQGKPHRRIVVYRVADGREVDRIEQGNAEPFGLFAFRPRSSTLAYWDDGKAPPVLSFRDVVRRQDVASLPGVGPSEIAFSPDGEKLALRKDFAPRIYEAAGLREEQSRQQANGPYGFLTNDELLIEEAGSLRGWNVRTGRDSYTFPIPQGKAFHLQNSCGPAVILVDRTPAQTVSLWDVRTGKEVARLDDAMVGQWGFGLRLTAPSPLLAFNVRSRPGEILLYDAVRRLPRSRIFGVVEAQGNFNSEQLSSLSPDGRLLAAYARVNGGTGPNSIQIWDVETAQKVGSLGDCINPIWSPDGRHLVTIAPAKMSDLVGTDTRSAGSRSLVKIWEVADPTPSYRQDRPVTAISSSADGHRLAVNDQLWGVGSDRGRGYLKPMLSPVPADIIAFTVSGSMYAGQRSRPELSKQLRELLRWPTPREFPKQFEQPIPFWQLEPHARLLALPVFERVEGTSYFNDERLMAFSPDGRLAAVYWERLAANEKFRGSVGEQIDLWDLAAPNRLRVFCRNWTRPQVGSMTVLFDARQLVFSSDSKKLAIAFQSGVRVYDVSDGEVVRWLVTAVPSTPGRKLHIPPHCLAFSPDGQFVCFGGEQGRLSIGMVEPTTGEPTVESSFFPPSFAPGDQSSKVAPTHPQSTWAGHDGTVRAVAVSPDGRTLASGGEDRMICLWELPTARPLARWEAHDTNVTALAFRPDGQTLVSGADDGMLKLWDIPMIRRELAAMGLDW